MIVRRQLVSHSAALNLDSLTRTILWRSFADAPEKSKCVHSGEKTTIVDKFDEKIPMDKISAKFCRSSGPGGQNVNTLSTKVELRFEVRNAEWIPASIRDNMIEKLPLTKSGHLVITSDKTRTQEENMKDALEKLKKAIKSCEPIVKAEPSPELLAKLKKRQENAAKERLNFKRMRSSIKGSRGAV